MLAALLLVSSASAFAGSSIAEAQGSSCPASTVDVAAAKPSEIQRLAGMRAASAKTLVVLRDAGAIVAIEDLRQLRINDRRFQKFVLDERSCFAGQPLTALLPGEVCAPEDARLNSSKVAAVAERIGWKSARLLVRARPLLGYDDIAKIPERGDKIVGRLARKGGTCLDQPPLDQLTFGEGRHVVGVDIAAGRFVATEIAGCTWERSASLTGGVANLIASGSRSSALQVVVDIDVSDVSFASFGCGTWTRIDVQDPDGLAEIPGDGDWLVSDQIAPGIYRASAAERCIWTRFSAMSGFDTDAIEQAELLSTLVLVEVDAADEVFTTKGCGTWALVARECLNQLEAVYPAELEMAPHIYGVSDSVLLSTQYEIGLALPEYTVNWGGFGGLNVPSSIEVVEIEIGEGKVTGSTVIVGLGHAYRGVMEPFYADYIDTLMGTFPEHVDRVIWVAPSRFNTMMPFVVATLYEALDRWPQLEIADFWIEADAQSHPEWFPDGLHLDPEGRLAMADYLRDKLLRPCG